MTKMSADKKYPLIKDDQREARIFQQRIRILLILCLVFMFIVIARLIYLQIDLHHFYSILSEHNQFTWQPIAPKRGLIYDRNGVILAENKPLFRLEIQRKNSKTTIKRLRQYLSLSPYEIDAFHKQSKLHKKTQYIPIKNGLTDAELAYFSANKYQFPTAQVRAGLIRYYPQRQYTAHVVGQVGRITAYDLKTINTLNYQSSYYIGKSGIEQSLESLLHGQIGYQQVENDAQGNIVRTTKRIPPVAGYNIYLTIDSQLQVFAHQCLGAEKGSIVMIQPNTGQLLALVSHPSYDPNRLVQKRSKRTVQQLYKDPGNPLFDRSIQGQFALASIIKLFEALTALDKEIITPYTQIYDQGKFHAPGSKHIYHDWKTDGHGWVNVTKAIIVSCDVFFYRLGIKLGIAGINSILSQFGFGHIFEKLPLFQQSAGLLPTPQWKLKNRGQPWYIGDTINSSIGQGYLLVTPLQLAYATSILANRGRRILPNVLLKVQAMHSKQSYTPKTRIDPPIVLQHKKFWQLLINAMQKVIATVHGTGYHFGPHPRYTVAGKTGTAQLMKHSNLDLRHIPKKLWNNSLFIAFAPINKPKIAIAVIVEHAPGRAIHIGRKLLDYYLLKIEKTNEKK